MLYQLKTPQISIFISLYSSGILLAQHLLEAYISSFTEIAIGGSYTLHVHDVTETDNW